MENAAEKGRVFPSPEVTEAVRVGVKRYGVAGLVKKMEGVSWSPVMAIGFGASASPAHLEAITRHLVSLGLLGVEV